MDDLVERCLRQAALWDEVKDKLQESGLALSGVSNSGFVSLARWRSTPM